MTRRARPRAGWAIALGDRLRAAREARGLTQRELARRGGLTPDVISRLENGHFQNPGLRTLRRVAESLGVDAAELLRDDRPRPPADATRLRIERWLDAADEDQRALIERVIAAIVDA